LIPALGQRTLSEISLPDVRAVLQPAAPLQSRRRLAVVATLGAILEDARRGGLIEANPCRVPHGPD